MTKLPGSFHTPQTNNFNRVNRLDAQNHGGTIHTKAPQSTDMEVSKIEEMIEEFERQMPLMRAHGKLLCATASPTTYKKLKDWLRQALTEAHQAGIDEAVELLKEKRNSHCGKEDCLQAYCINRKIIRGFCDNTIKALQKKT